MKHKHAELIKAWAEDSESVQFRNKDYPGADWYPIKSSGAFDYYGFCEFRLTPKPAYDYADSRDVGGSRNRCQEDNIRLTYIDGKLTAVELITEGDGK